MQPIQKPLMPGIWADLGGALGGWRLLLECPPVRLPTPLVGPRGCLLPAQWSRQNHELCCRLSQPYHNLPRALARDNYYDSPSRLVVDPLKRKCPDPKTGAIFWGAPHNGAPYQQDDENDSPPTEGTVRHPSADGDGPGVGFMWGKLSLNGTHPVRLRRPPLRWRGFSEEENQKGMNFHRGLIDRMFLQES